MKKTIAALAALICMHAATAQKTAQVTLGSGKIATEKRVLENYNAIYVSGPFHIRLVSGNETAITLKADNNIISLITTEVKDNVLMIMPMPGKLFRSSKGNKMTINVPFKMMKKISLSGSGSITSGDAILDDVKVTLDGAGNIDLKLKSDKAEACVLGSGTMKLRGTAAAFKCKIVGSGSVQSASLDAADVDVVISGSGEARVRSSNIIKGRITGSGNVAFTGDPSSRDLQRTGTGDFKIL
jgi:hypothetical protein